jgi:hypothetical protein
MAKRPHSIETGRQRRRGPWWKWAGVFSRAIFAVWMLAVLCFAAAPDFHRDVRPILERNCFDCHGDEAKPKGGVNLERFCDEAAVMRERDAWLGVFEKIESHQMPPPKREEQPSPDDRKRVLAWLDDIFARPDARLGVRDPGAPVLRRLTRLEYNNTVRDLFGLKLDIFVFPERLPVDKRYFDPAAEKMPERLEIPLREPGLKYAVLLPDAGLPGENRAEHGYRNRGEAMNLSPLLLERYLAMGRAIVHSPKLPELSLSFRALIENPEMPPRAELVRMNPAEAVVFTTAREFVPNFNMGGEAKEGDLVTRDYQFRYALRELLDLGNGGIWDAEARDLVVPAEKSIHVRYGPDGGKAFVIKPRESLWVTGFSTAHETSGEGLFTNHLKGQKTFTLDLSLEAAEPGEGISEVALMVLSRDRERGRVTITARYSDGSSGRLSAEITPGQGRSNTFFAFRAPEGRRVTELVCDGSEFSGNHVLLDDFGFITKILEPAQKVVPIAKVPARDKTKLAHARLREWISKAFRRPVEESEVSPYVGIFVEAQKKGADFADSMREALAAVLAAPDFLYLAEPRNGRADIRKLTGHEIASRMAYFLWAAPPDAELRRAADLGQLQDDAELERQTRRMLRDARVRELSESFAVQWLRLDQLAAAKPDERLFKSFYFGPNRKLTLHGSMLIEALLLFETTLVEKRSILDFIDADYSWLNLHLTKLYGIAAAPLGLGSGDTGNYFRDLQTNAVWFRAKLPSKTRGGFFTMAGPLTVTSLPDRTSPVKRGAWLLETIFNRPPQEPKVAFVLKEESKGKAVAATVRERFEMHRNEPACYSCHVRLDPPGFALEVFDPIGGLRTKDGGRPVDARSDWNGEAFDGPAGFKSALMRKSGEFTRGFIEHLLSYALCRKLGAHDQQTIAEIQRAAEADGWRLDRIIVEIVKSYPFRNVRTES